LNRPHFLDALRADPDAWRTFTAACAALAAAGLDPQLLDPGLPLVRAALRAAPDLQTVIAVGALAQSGFLLLGGFAADTWESRRLVQAGLVTLVAASILGLLFPSPPLLLAGRVLGWAGAGLILPFAIASIALVYTGPTRALALGIAYAVVGFTNVVAVILISILGDLGPRWPAFVACLLVSLVALRIWARRATTLRPRVGQRGTRAAAVALGAFGVVAIVLGLVDFGDTLVFVRASFIVLGLAAAGGAYVLGRRLRMTSAAMVRVRPLVIALVVGAAVGFAFAIPLLHVPLYFQIIEGESLALSVLALAPFGIALVVAAPTCDFLIRRYSPRVLISGGTVALGLADLTVALVIGRGTPYVLFVLPFIMLGAGFVIATSVRTALIFASMPSQLPASAAAINEASVNLGNRLGAVVGTLVLTRVALAVFAGSFGGLPPAELEAHVGPFRELLAAAGLPGFAGRLESVDPATLTAYFEAASRGLQASHLVGGLVAVVAGLAAYPLLRSVGPLGSTWDLADERPGIDAGAAGADRP
jgi:MFS family permease